jgi:hypothetical protein
VDEDLEAVVPEGDEELELPVQVPVYLTLEDRIDVTFAQLDKIAQETKVLDEEFEQTLYKRLSRVYVLYYYWMNSPDLEKFEGALDEYLENKWIPFNSATSVALKFTKIFLGETKIQKASKYANHIEAACNKDVTPEEYPGWLNENGIEITSRKKSVLKGAKKVPKKNKSDYMRAVNLIYTWLELRESSPLYSSEADTKVLNTTSFQSVSDPARTHYEITISKRYNDLKNKDKCSIDTLWVLPRLPNLEQLLIHHLAHGLMHHLDELEALVAAANFEEFNAEIEDLIEDDAFKQFWWVGQENQLRAKVGDAQLKDEDVGAVYANYKPVPPKRNKGE